MGHSIDNEHCGCSFCQQAEIINKLSLSEKKDILRVLVSDMCLEKIREIDRSEPAINRALDHNSGDESPINEKSIEEIIKELETMNTTINNIFGEASPRRIH